MELQERSDSGTVTGACYRYRAYGLSIESNFRLDEFREGPGPAEVAVELIDGAPAPHPLEGPQGFVRFDRDEVVYVGRPFGVFRVTGGRRIEMWPSPEVDRKMLRFFAIGNLMAMLLYQRGRLVLHASCAGVGENGAVAFVGTSGAGKSTMAAAFDASGHCIVSDDVVAIDTEDAFRVPPGYPYFKIAPEAADALGYAADELAYLHAYEEQKRGCAMRNHDAATETRSLTGIILLDVGEEDKLTRLRGQEGLIALIPHTFPTRMVQPGDALHLGQLARLVRDVPVYRLTRRADLGALERQVHMILDAVDPGPRLA